MPPWQREPRSAKDKRKREEKEKEKKKRKELISIKNGDKAYVYTKSKRGMYK